MRTFKIQSIIFLALSIAGACQVWGSDLQTMKSPLFPFQSTSMYQEDFNTGSNTSGGVGLLGWVVAGTVANQPSEVNRPGIWRFDTGAAAGTISRLSFPNSSAFDSSSPHIINWIVRLNTNDGNTTMRSGAANSVAGNPPANGIYIEKLDADTNWFCVTRAAGVQTRTDSGIAVSTNFIKLNYRRNSSGVEFRLNDALVCTHTTNIPTALISPYGFIINSAAASKTFDTDYFDMILYGLTR